MQTQDERFLTTGALSSIINHHIFTLKDFFDENSQNYNFPQESLLGSLGYQKLILSNYGFGLFKSSVTIFAKYMENDHFHLI
jgi:hypothetical protein